MPNHVTNQITVTGPAESLAAFRAALLVPGEADSYGRDDLPQIIVDFNGILPMPASLHLESGSATYRAEIWNALADDLPIAGEEAAKLYCIDRIRELTAGHLDWETATVGRLKEVFGQHPGLAEQCGLDLHYAEQIKRNIELYGSPTWYEWCNRNWGTKWNAYHQHIGYLDEGELYLEFDTAWSPPEPVYEAIAERFPDLQLEIRYIDEGGGFAGTYEIKDGILHDYPCSDEEFRMFAEEHFGWDYSEDDDEE